MRYRYFICDVFTETRFGGNPVAVLPEAAGLSDAQMQQVAREFNFSETTFVFPPEAGHTRSVRIFTPSSEVPFAGHPNIGTAYALARAGELGDLGASAKVTFEERAGLVAIAIERRGDAIHCELRAPRPLELGRSLPPERVAAAVSLARDDVVTAAHAPQEVSVGLEFLIAELAGRDALARARPDVAALEALAGDGFELAVHVYTRSDDAFDLRARMFAPLGGVPEDPATGSAGCALAGLLAHLDDAPDGDFAWRIAQGVEMGRPSALSVRAEKRDGTVTGTWVGGPCVSVAEGVIEVD